MILMLLAALTAQADEPHRPTERHQAAIVGCDSTRVSWSLGADMDIHCHAGFGFRNERASVHFGPFMGYGQHMVVLVGSEGEEEDDDHEIFIEPSGRSWRGQHRHIEFGGMIEACLRKHGKMPAMCGIIEAHDQSILSGSALVQVAEHWSTGVHARFGQLWWDRKNSRLVSEQALYGPAIRRTSTPLAEEEGLATFVQVSAGWGRYMQPLKGEHLVSGQMILTFGFHGHAHGDEHHDE